MRLEALARELVRRGWRVQAIERTADDGQVIVGLDMFEPGRRPNWRKAVLASADPDAVEHALQQWQGGVVRDILQGSPSPVVRQMIAEHGLEEVMRALNGREPVA